jgi:O-6-methylguanine DNA methyltransferase
MLMIDLVTLDHLRQAGNVLHERFISPVGDIYILGDDTTLKALMFQKSYPRGKNIGTIFPKGSSATITKAINILDHYFHGFSSREKSGPGKPVVHKISFKNESLDLTMHDITLKLDLMWFTPKEMQVYSELLKIQAGSTISYGDLARRSGIPGGARFVGNTMAKNTFPIIIPCHRVIKSDGSMGNYSGGVNIKKHLLDLEQS